MKHSASDFLRSEHREVEAHLDTLLHALKHLSPERVKDIRQSVEAIRGLVGAHMDIEERIFYPALSFFAEELLPGMLKQHEEIREADRCLGQLLSGSPEPPTDRDMGELYRLGVELHDAVQVHIVDEEDQLLQLVDEKLSSAQQGGLLAAMQGGVPAMQEKPGRGPMRQPEPASRPILECDLAKEIEQLRREEPWQTTGRNAKTIVKHQDFRIVLTVLRANARIKEHQTAGRTSVQTIAGHIRMRVSGNVHDLPEGRLLALDSALPHDVEALADSAFLLTIAFPGVH